MSDIPPEHLGKRRGAGCLQGQCFRLRETAGRKDADFAQKIQIVKFAG